MYKMRGPNDFLWMLVFIVCSSAAFQIGIIVDKDWIATDLSIYDGATAGSTFVNFTTHNVEGHNVMKATSKVCDLLSKGYGGFICFVDCPTALTLNMQAKSRGIPHIMYVKKPCYLGQSIETFQLTPPCSEINEAVKQIVSRLKWWEVFLIHDDSLESRCLQDAIIKFSSIAVRSRILTISKLSIQNIIDVTKKHNPSVIVLFVRDDTLINILREANDQQMLTSTKSWIVVTNDIPLPKILNVTAEVSRIIYMRQYNTKLQLEDKTCANKWPEDLDNSTFRTDLLSDIKLVYQTAIDNIKKASPSYTFEAFECRGETQTLPSGNKLMTEINKIQINGRTGSLGWNSNKYPAEVGFQICSNKNNLESLHHMGKWTTSKGLDLVKGVLFGNEFTDFGSRRLTVATLQAEPFVYINEENGVKKYSGFCIDILNELAKRFNFSYKIVSPPDGQYGGPKDDGTWSGMVGMTMQGEIDFAIGPFTITSIRETVIDFTKPYMEDGVGILTKKITEEPYKIFKTLKPFSLQVWGAIGVVIIVVGVLIFFVNRLSPYTVDGEDIEGDSAKDQKRLKDNLWLIYGSFLEQGVDPRPSANSGRIMLGCWWVFTILITSTYTANLAAYLTVSITVQPINSLAELVAQDDIQPLVKAGTNLHTLFKNAKTGIYKQVWDKMSKMPYVTTRAGAVELTKTGKYAFMTDLSQLEYVQLMDCESLALADEVFNQAGLGFVVPENAPFKDAFNLNIMKMQEAGMTERWRDKWWPKINSCSKATRTGGAEVLGMDSIAGLFYVYVGVVGLSIIVFVMDLICRMCIVNKFRIYSTDVKNNILRKISVKTPAKK